MATILVADDNSNIQKMVTLALKDQGIEVIAVGNGEAAVRKLPDVRPDLVLADIFMPVRNGYEVCEFVKGDARYGHIPVILLVGAFDPFDEREAHRVGADGVLKKPFVPPDRLITMVKSVLARTAGEHAVPVGAPVSATVASHSAQMAATREQESLPEPQAEEFAPASPPVTFTENESPLAFSELLEAPTVETDGDPVEPQHEEPMLPATGLGEMCFWQSPSAIEEVPARPEAPARNRPTPPSPLAVEDESVEAVPETPFAGEPAESLSQPVPALPVEPPSPFEVARAVTEWVEAAHNTPAEPPAPAIETAAQEPEAAVEPEPSHIVPAEEAVAGNSQEAAPSALVSELAPPDSAAEPEPGRAPVAEHAMHQAVESLELSPQPSPELVNQVVARVIERMQPQILDIVTREILKPVVEALVRRELEKR